MWSIYQISHNRHKSYEKTVFMNKICVSTINFIATSDIYKFSVILQDRPAGLPTGFWIISGALLPTLPPPMFCSSGGREKQGSRPPTRCDRGVLLDNGSSLVRAQNSLLAIAGCWGVIFTHARRKQMDSLTISVRSISDKVQYSYSTANTDPRRGH